MRRDRHGAHEGVERGGGRRRRRPPRIRVVRDAEEVFRAAIDAGVLSGRPSDRDWAGHYFYMFHDEAGVAWFKHRETRDYVFMPARGRCDRPGDCDRPGRGAGGRR